MPDLSLSDLEAFACVARHQSFRRASLERDVSVSLLSQTVRRLEEQIGVSLLKRTTRSVAVTDAGSELLASLTPAFAQITDAVERVNSFRDTPMGVLRVSAPAPIAQFLLARLAARFLLQHPAIRLEIHSDAALIDIVKSGFDAGVRFDDKLAQDMVAIPIGPPQRYAVVASPAYLREHGRPTTPSDLNRQSCIRNQFPGGTILNWDFVRKGAKATVVPHGPLTVNDAQTSVHAAIEGVGFAYVHESYVHSHVSSGNLVRVLEAWSPGIGRPYLYYAKQRYMPAALRAFIQFAKVNTA